MAVLSRTTKAVLAGIVGGTLAGSLSFVWLLHVSTLPVLSPVSLSLAFRPWTKCIAPSIVVGLVVFVLAFVPVWFRAGPQRSGSKRFKVKDPTNTGDQRC